MLLDLMMPGLDDWEVLCQPEGDAPRSEARGRAMVRTQVVEEVQRDKTSSDTRRWLGQLAADQPCVGGPCLLLTAFGLGSVIELVTGGVLLWRLSTEAHGGSMARVERVENRAAWFTGIGLILLCLYIIVSAGAGLLPHERPEASPVGIGLALAAVVGMPLLAWRKRAIAARLDSAALCGDAACSMTCAYMAATLLVGLLLTAALGWWCADSVAALAFLYWLQHEARETLDGARAGRGGCGCGDPSCEA